MEQCSINDCDRPRFSKGFCRMHYERSRRHGDPLKCLKTLSPKGAPKEWLASHKDFVGQDCLIWPFARHPSGRAHMSGGKPARFMCELRNGSPPTPKHQAAHSCGNAHGGCVNPNHLRWATAVENAADKEAHGTVIRGEKHYAAKLSDADVRRVRALAGSMPQKEIAAMFGVWPSAICKILKGHSRVAHG